MGIAEYALSILQLSELPVTKLVPRLAAIKKGLINKVNFSNFQFDRESFAPLLKALSSKECKLDTVKLSVGSIINLDIDSCKVLGRLLYDNGVNIKISKSVNSLYVKSLFESMDLGNTGYVTRQEFFDELIEVNSSFVGLNEKDKTRYVVVSFCLFLLLLISVGVFSILREIKI